MRFTRSSTKRFVAALTVGLVGLGLAGCAGADDAPSSGKTTISYWSWVPGTEKVVATWNKAHPDARVDFSRIDASTAQAKLQASAKAGTAPCVAQVGFDQLYNAVVNGELMDVTKEAAKYESNYVPFAWGLSGAGGKTYGLPQDIGPLVMYYRTDLFQKYGISVPTTWDEYAAAARKVHAQDPSVSLGVFPATDSSTFSAYAWQNGAHWYSISGDKWIVDIDGDETREVAKFFQPLIDDKSLPVVDTGAPSYNKSLASGTILSTIAAAWYAPQLAGNVKGTAGNWRVAQMPSWGSSQATASSGGSLDAITKDCKNPGKALEFVNWMNSSKASMGVLMDPDVAGLYPAGKKALEFPIVHEKNPFFGGQDLGAEFATSAKNVPQDWNFGPVTAQSQQAVTEALGAVADGKTIASQLPGLQKAALSAMKAKGIAAAAAK